MSVKIHPEWAEVLSGEFSKDYFKHIVAFLKEEKKMGKVIYPDGPNIFQAFDLTPFSQVKAVVLGQDPYHGYKQAHGLCFSVQRGITPPPSLVNIYKELKDDLDIDPPPHGYLASWAEQGLLMLNASLTVEAGKPMSHSKIGWEQFTDTVIKKISEQKEGIVFLLWGRFAQQKEALIDNNKHVVLKAAHPSPFSAYAGFMGCKHFSKTNKLLRDQGKEPINWKLPA